MFMSALFRHPRYSYLEQRGLQPFSDETKLVEC
jgi:hypothetical protein